MRRFKTLREALFATTAMTKIVKYGPSGPIQTNTTVTTRATETI